MARRLSKNPLPAAALGVGAVILLICGALLVRNPATEQPRQTPSAAAGTQASATPAGSTLVEGIAGRPLYLNPLLSQFSPADADVTRLIFSGLTKPGEHGEPLPDLAERWEVSGDGKSYTFVLRAGVKWHDGTLFSSEDVSATIGLIQQDGFPGLPSLAAFWKGVVVETPDAGTVVFRLREPYGPFPNAVSLGILQARRWSGVKGKALAESELNDSPVGTGPYQLKRTGDDELVLQANPAYYGRIPSISEIVIRFYQNAQSLAAAIKSGDVMASTRLRQQDVSSLAGNSDIQLVRGDLASGVLVYLNSRLPYFQDRGTRQALYYALDRQRIIDVAAGGSGEVWDSPILPSSWAYNAQVKKYGYDPEQARALLDKAGWKVGTDGIRERTEIKFQFSLLTNDDPQRIAVAEEISRQWMAVGVKADVQSVGAYGLVRDFLEPRRFEAVVYGWAHLGYDPDQYELWHSSQATGTGGNYAGWVNPKVDEWLEDARRSSDRAARAVIYQQFQDYFVEQLPALLVYQPSYTYALSKRVTGVRPVPLDDLADRFLGIPEWSIGGVK